MEALALMPQLLDLEGVTERDRAAGCAAGDGG